MKRAILFAFLAAFLGIGCSTQPVKTVWLDEMDLSTMETGWGSNRGFVMKVENNGPSGASYALMTN